MDGISAGYKIYIYIYIYMCVCVCMCVFCVNVMLGKYNIKSIAKVANN
jgi:hypothetical protein